VAGLAGLLGRMVNKAEMGWFRARRPKPLLGSPLK
jgi:hypothetical protein